jgi:hypothetical protein
MAVAPIAAIPVNSFIVDMVFFSVKCGKYVSTISGTS